MQKISDITVHKRDEASVLIKTDPRILNEIKENFSAYVDNYQFMPAFKKGWSGKMSALHKNILPIGLLKELQKFAIGGDYSIYIDFNDKQDVDRDEFNEYIKDLKLPFDLYEFQEQAAYEAVSKTKLCITVPTSGGKSLIQYIIACFIAFSDHKILIIVPTIHLVDQLFQDFMEYGLVNPYDNCHRIYGGQDKFNKTKDIEIILENNKTISLHGNDSLTVINNTEKKIIYAKNLSETDEIEDEWITQYFKK